MIKQRMVELNYSRIYKSYTIELKHKETNTWYSVQEANIQIDWFFITKMHINQKHKPINYPNYATYEIKTCKICRNKPCFSSEHQKLFWKDLTDIYKEFAFQRPIHTMRLLVTTCSIQLISHLVNVKIAPIFVNWVKERRLSLTVGLTSCYHKLHHVNWP